MTERIITAMDDYGKQLSDVAAAHPEPEDDEHELAELRQRWASIAQVTREALFTARADGTLQWASEEAIRLMGLRRHDARGIRLSDLVDQADRARVTAGIQAAIGGRAAECRVRWRNVPGNPWVSLRFGPAVIGDTRTSVGGTITDIDAEVVAHEAFLHERRELEDLLHRTVEPHMRLEAVRGDDGTIIDFIVVAANEAARRHVGLQVGDRVGTELDAMMAEGEHEASSLSRLSSVVESGGEQLLLRDLGEGDVDAEDAHRFDLRAVKVSDGVLLSWRDVTQRHRLAAALSASEQDFRLLAESIGDVVRILDVDGVQRWVSPSVTDLLGYSPEELVGTYAQAIMHPDDIAEAVESGIRVGLAQGTVTPPRRTRLRHANGHWVWTETTNSFAFDDDGRVIQLYAVTRDAEAAVQAEAELQRLARTDPLTGLLNRSSMIDRLNRLAADHPAQTVGTAVLFCDLDDLKTINDTLGHAAGDAVIVTATQRISDLLAHTALLARFGGDELLIAIPDAGGSGAAMDIAESLRAALAQPTPIPTIPTEVAGGVSIGVALWRLGESVDQVISRADQAMYEAKTTGRNRVILAS